MREPDVSGVRGKAWRHQADAATRVEWPAGLDLWLLHCPGAHPFWSWYVISACSLADIPGVPPAKRESASMTHEVLVFALHPDYQPTEAWCTRGEGRWSAHFLTPSNLVEQIADFTDELTIEVVTLLVRSFCDGLLSPDEDYRSANASAIQATASHLRAGRHVPS